MVQAQLMSLQPAGVPDKAAPVCVVAVFRSSSQVLEGQPTYQAWLLP